MPEQTAVKERPIIFTTESVQAILADRKTQTRRVLKDIPTNWHLGKRPDSYGAADFAFLDMADPVGTYPTLRTCPYGSSRDQLWVKETAWYDTPPMLDIGRRCFYIDGKVKMERTGSYGWSVGGEVQAAAGHLEELYALNGALQKKPSIFMPRWASRITLEIVDVRVQRVQEISEADAEAEGVEKGIEITRGRVPAGQPGHRTGYGVTFKSGYHHLWNTINGKRGFGWARNPWVWVVKFRRIQDHRSDER